MASKFQSLEPCLCCDTNYQRCYHHEYTRKAYPEFKHEKWNLISVCLKHHNEIHNKGLDHAARKYSNLIRWLLKNGWYQDEFDGKWKNKSADKSS
jgi:hypothetical protein